MPIEMKNRISNSFINFIENNKAVNYISSINPKIPIREQNIRKETKEVLGIIYKEYLCSDEQRNFLDKEEQKEIMQFEKRMREKYNSDNIFRNKKNNQVENKSVDEVALVEYKKQNVFNKIRNFILRYIIKK